MTKERAPLTFAQAVTRVAGLLGWEEAARVVERSERTLRLWSEPGSGASPTIEQALKLDVAYQAAGGRGAPIFETYAARLDRETVDALADLEALAISTAATAKETGEAVSALILAARPGATRTDRVRAELEAGEAISALSTSLRQLGCKPV